LDKLYANKQLICIGQWLYFQGSQYNGQQEEKKVVSTAPSPAQASSSHQKDAMDYQLPTDVLNSNSSRTHPSSSTHLLKDQFGGHQLPVHYHESNPEGESILMKVGESG
jgi:hypothetical protein